MVEPKHAPKVVRSIRDRRLTIPVEYHRQLRIDDQPPLHVRVEESELRLKRVRETGATRGSPGLRDLYDNFEPVREEIHERGIPEAEVNVDIDAAIAAARAARRSRSR